METAYTIVVYRNGGKHETAELLPRAAALAAGEELENAALRYELARTPEGKPYFPRKPGLQASVTHSGEYWLCALGKRPVGLDLQIHQKSRRQQISKRFFHPAEDAFLLLAGYEPFFDVWAAKESYVKFIGEGLQYGLANFTVASAEGMLSGVNGVQLRSVPFAEGYSLYLCAEKIGAIRLLEGQ